MLRITLFLFTVLLFPFVTSAQNGTWEWVTGTNDTSGAAVFGTMGVPDPLNTPGATSALASWKDQQGNFWVFGGRISFAWDFNSALWKFDPLIGQWTFMKGSTQVNAPGIYGTQTVPSAANYPGGRSTFCSWVDQQGNFWLFGGLGYDINGTFGGLNDLWKYDIATNMWTWMKGSTTVYDPGNSGTYQVPSASTNPYAVTGSYSLLGSAPGELWMKYSDLVWRYTIATNIWTWMKGSGGLTQVNYGTQFVSSPTNTPGSRSLFGQWTDANGKFWIYGGHGLYNNNVTAFGDVWRFDPVTLEWTWMAGSVTTPGTFTQQCQPGGEPTSRSGGTSCGIDACGRMWAFGGGDQYPTIAYNDLWLFDPNTNQFTWITDSLMPQQSGIWGTQGVPSSSNHPPAMRFSSSFRDNQGNVWIFGGYHPSNTASFNTLWKYTPDPSCSGSPIPPIVTAMANSNSGCVPFTVLFNTAASTNVSYQWDFGDPAVTTDTSSASNPSYTYTSTGTYTATVIVSASNNCVSGQDTATISITVNNPPVAIAGTDQVICEGDAVQLNASGGITYSWSPTTALTDPAIANPVASPVQTTNYIVTVGDGTCFDDDTITISVIPAPVVVLSNNTTIQMGDSVALLVAGGISYQWFPETGLSCTTCANPIASPTVTTNYCVTVTDSTACTKTACTEVRIEYGELFVPNAFSPNEDGQNDILFVRFIAGSFDRVTFRVYDRWGKQVFETTDPAIGWDGYVQGQQAIPAVYVYTVDAIRADGAHHGRKGNVTLIR
jgi:gliding motility-associated-like protein